MQQFTGLVGLVFALLLVTSSLLSANPSASLLVPTHTPSPSVTPLPDDSVSPLKLFQDTDWPTFYLELGKTFLQLAGSCCWPLGIIALLVSVFVFRNPLLKFVRSLTSTQAKKRHGTLFTTLKTPLSLSEFMEAVFDDLLNRNINRDRPPLFVVDEIEMEVSVRFATSTEADGTVKLQVVGIGEKTSNTDEQVNTVKIRVVPIVTREEVLKLLEDPVFDETQIEDLQKGTISREGG